MKWLVEGIQVLIITVMIYPLFYIWDTSQVEQFCRDVEAGMNKQEFIQLIDDKSVKATQLLDMSGHWYSAVVTRSPFSSYHCEIAGVGDVVASARLY
ncbi:MAG: hypothetical protein COA90_01275 [Gammaproteobacteria bacterium]|nr:MAG: hypothetical protein COA90_01275 [Gammaproteobacteria bacterium]